MSQYVKFCCHIAWAALLVTGLIASALADSALYKPNNSVAFLVLAPDRGFLGNEEITDAFDLFAKKRNASLVFVTDERTLKYLRIGLNQLMDKGAEHIVIIPLFISAAAPRYQLARALLENEKLTTPISYTRSYGESFFAAEDLAAKFHMIPHPENTNLIVVGYGAVDNDSEQKMLVDWQRIAKAAVLGFNFSSIKILIGHEGKGENAERRTAALKQGLANAIANNESLSTVVVPFHFGPRFDSMMSFDERLRRLLPAGAQLLQGNPRAEDLATWLQREANQNQRLTREDVGVVFLSHGSDFNWNESIREAVHPLAKRYKIEFVFSMADQATIERALRKLELRGVQAAVIVRAFALEQSFRDDIERMTGLDIEDRGMTLSPAREPPHRAYGPHGHGWEGSPMPRIRTVLPIQTVGGLGSSPLFAAALLDRARELSRNPARDTIILVAHGSGDHRLNDEWLTVLKTIAEHMRVSGGDEFLAIKVATWREDWPDKRAPWVEKIRDMVEEAAKQGGRAIVIPARITGEGPERKFLSGLEYDLGSGFAPHPLFLQWVEEKIRDGIARFANIRNAGGATEEVEDHDLAHSAGSAKAK